MEKFIKFLLFLAVGLTVFFLVMQQAGSENINQAFMLFFSVNGLLILLLTSLFIFLGIVKWKSILKSLGHKFKLRQLSPLWLLGFAISYVTPFSLFGGEIFRMYFTKKRFPELKWEKPMASVAIDKLLDATVFFLFLIAGLISFTFFGQLNSLWTIIGIVIMAAALFSLLAIFYIKRYKKESALEWLINIVGLKKTRFINGKQNREAIFLAEKEVFDFFDVKKIQFWKAAGITFLRYIIHFMRGLVLVFFIVGNIGFLKSLAVYSFASLSSLTPMPATLGALEIGQGIVFRVLGFGFGTGTVFSMVWRGADLMVCLVGAIFLIIYTVKLAEEKVLRFFEKSDKTK